jgi:MoaA/NifB/PqqE/SkfB family radical SAM enzyme
MFATTSDLISASRLTAPPSKLRRACANPAPSPLAEFRRYRPQPGHPDFRTLQREAEQIAARLLPRLERPPRGTAEWKRRARAWHTAATNYAENRRRSRAGRGDLLPLYFIWTTLRPCNFRCTYCDDHQGAKYPELSGRGKLNTAQGKRLLRIMRSRCPSVYFAGGEPTLRKDLPQLTRAARQLDYYPLVLNTNASLFHKLLEKPEWAGLLSDIDVLVVSLDALCLDTLEKLWATPRPVDVIRNLLVLRLLAPVLGFKLMVNTVIQPGLIPEARAVLDFASDMGLVFCPVPMNSGPCIDARVQQDPEYAALVETILERKRGGQAIAGSLRMNERLLSAAPLQCRNTVKPHVDHDGRLAWPCKASVNVKPEYVNVLDFEHVDDLFAHAAALVSPTDFHGPAKNQCGANCGWAQNYTTDAYAHGVEHPTALLREAADFLRARH